jgi:hypothetical protein
MESPEKSFKNNMAGWCRPCTAATVSGASPARKQNLNRGAPEWVVFTASFALSLVEKLDTNMTG